VARGNPVRTLLERAEGMPYGFARTATVEEAVRAADAGQDLDAAFAARVALASAAVHGGEPQKGLVAVTWCLGQIDAHPGRFEKHDTYWALKWLPTMLLDRPEIPLAEVERVIAEAERRYTAEGEGADAIAKLRWLVPKQIGRADEAVEAHRPWRMLARSEYSDCRACDVAGEVELALALGEPERALDLARPVLAERVTCLEEPGGVIGTLLEPLHALGRRDEAERLHTWGLRLVRGNPSMVVAQSQHVLHLVRTGRLAEAFELAAELVDVCDRGLFRLSDRMEVAAAASAVVAAWAAAGAGQLHRSLGDRPTDPVALAAALADEARGTAAAFDRRNGTTAVSEDVARALAVRPVGTTGSVPAAAVARTPPTAPAAPASAAPASPAPASAPAGPDQEPTAAAMLQRAREPRGTAEQRHAAAAAALAAYLAAGDRAGVARARRTIGGALLRLDRLEEAAEALEQAVDELADQPLEQVRAALGRARVALAATGDTGDEVAQRYLRVAREAAEGDGDLARGLVLLAEAEWAVLGLGEDAGPTAHEVAAAEFTEARRLLAEDPEEVQDAWIAEAFARSVAGDHDGAMTAATAAWQLAERSGSAVDQGAAAEVLVPLLLQQGQLERAIDALGVAQRAEERLDDPGEAGEAAAARAEILGELDRAQEALAAAWTAVDLFGAAGDGSGAAWARLTVARVFRDLDQDQNAFDLLSDLVEQAAEDGDRELEGAVALDLARLHGDFGFFDEALVAAGRALRCLDAADPGNRGKVHRTLAQIHEARGDMKQAVRAGEALLAELPGMEDAVLAAELLEDHTERLVRAGWPERALELYDDVRRRYTDAGMVVAAAASELGRAQALTALRRPVDAQSAVQRALETAERESVPELRAEALWALAGIGQPDAARFDAALQAYADAGAPPEQLAELTAERDAALGKGRSRWRRR
jgi:tetratricopeptide (TPR) repeat protein